VAKEVVNKISKQVINYETTKVTGLSFAASLPGGAAAVGAAAVDITSYFAFILRTVQELAYLYGFEEFDLNDDEVDAETMNIVLLFVGVMFGVQGSSTTLRKFADVISKQVAKKIAQKALTKGTIYPIVKKSVYNCRYPYDKADFCRWSSISYSYCWRCIIWGIDFSYVQALLYEITEETNDIQLV
jgi:hypothetical protein